MERMMPYIDINISSEEFLRSLTHDDRIALLTACVNGPARSELFVEALAQLPPQVFSRWEKLMTSATLRKNQEYINIALHGD
jgi:hypothetical protein